MLFLHFKLGKRHHYLKLYYNQILAIVIDFKHLFCTVLQNTNILQT